MQVKILTAPTIDDQYNRGEGRTFDWLVLFLSQACVEVISVVLVWYFLSTRDFSENTA